MKKTRIFVAIILVVVVALILFLMVQNKNKGTERSNQDIDWKKIYENYIVSGKIALYSEADENFKIENSYIAFVDLNFDNVPELIYSTGKATESRESILNVYTIEDQSVKKCNVDLFNEPKYYYQNSGEKKFFVCEQSDAEKENKKVIISLDSSINFSHYLTDNSYYVDGKLVSEKLYQDTLNLHFNETKSTDVLAELKVKMDASFTEEQKKKSVLEAIKKFENYDLFS